MTDSPKGRLAAGGLLICVVYFPPMFRPFIILFTLLLGACATQFGLRDNSEKQLTMFSQVVFAPDYDSRRTDYLAKWASPLRINLLGDDAEDQRTPVKSQAQALSKLTGLDIALASADKPANVTIYFATPEKMNELASAVMRDRPSISSVLNTNGCASYYDKDAGNRITSARVFVHTGEKVATVNSCISQQMTHILGMPNKSDLIQPSIFNAGAQLLQMTTLDLKMVRALYAPTLKPGMPRRDALLIADELLQN